jgi:Rrf2 family protein
MLRLSKKADYALMAMTYLASEAEDGTASAREIADRFDIPLELLAKVLQRLAREGYVVSHKGIRGGYGLARPMGEISVGGVVQAIDGPVGLTACGSTGEACEQFDRCTIRDPLSRLKARIVTALEAFSLSDLVTADAAPPVGVEQPLTLRAGRA